MMNNLQAFRLPQMDSDVDSDLGYKFNTLQQYQTSDSETEDFKKKELPGQQDDNFDDISEHSSDDIDSDSDASPLLKNIKKKEKRKKRKMEKLAMQ